MCIGLHIIRPFVCYIYFNFVESEIERNLPCGMYFLKIFLIDLKLKQEWNSSCLSKLFWCVLDEVVISSQYCIWIFLFFKNFFLKFLLLWLQRPSARELLKLRFIRNARKSPRLQERIRCGVLLWSHYLSIFASCGFLFLD